MIIAVDGYSSCGKSTLAKQIAQALSITYIDSGAMYRCVALFGIEKGFENGQEEKIIPFLKDIEISFGKGQAGEQRVFLNGVDVSEKIREMRVAGAVSFYAKIKEVRTFLVSQQQKFAQNTSIIMDGRDIGTVVFPNADLKIFMTASPEVRAKRRYDELVGKGKEVRMQEVLENLKERDFIDENREESPLRKADDAFVIDNSFLTREEQLEMVLEKVEKLAQK